ATSTQPNPSHVYASSGSYTVSLTVANALGSDTTTRASYVLVDVIPPIAAFGLSTSGGVAPLSVDFTDQSTGGVPTAWSWTFGDGGSSTARNPTHVYTASGYYTVSLLVSNAYGSDTLTLTSAVTVDYVPPSAAFSGTPTNGNSPFVVQFTDESTGGVATSWSWNFGDGGSSTARNPAHVYTLPGTYTVSLSATNAYGTTTAWRNGYVHVGTGPQILADFTAAPTLGPGPLTVQFTDRSVGNVVLWEWDFGDNTTSNLRNPTHVYAAPGEYDVSLQVTNANGMDDQLDRIGYVVVE
ncbi:MAG: PKD domain-containing protein, partial [Planctomycetes bacterium]|nr:PKD domain-containing protein [Planctomycetota bacterium]